jgi:16S rRNA (cytosine1402-N4)-methyltransferase
METFRHISVLADEVLAYLAPRTGGTYVDGTLGGGGHAGLVLEATAPDGRLLGFDRDAAALSAAGDRLAQFGDRVHLLKRNFADVAQVLAELEIAAIDGVVLDLGVSSHQLDSAERGFSFQQDAPLDMRMGRDSGPTAADLVNSLEQEELTRIIRDYGEERWAKKIAANIVKERQVTPLTGTLQLAELVKRTIPRALQEERIHPATRTFQGLRIAVNDELASLEQGLDAAIGLLRPGGRIVVISFHSLEDRIVKNRFRFYAQGCRCPKEMPVCVCGHQPELRVLTGKPVVAGKAEVMNNPRARSAKLRAAEKL